MKKTRFSRKIVGLFSAIGLVIYFLIAVLIMNQGIGFNSVPFFIIFVLILAVSIKYRGKIIDYYKKHLRLMKTILVVLLLLGIGARFLFLFVQQNFVIDSTLSDAGVHWYGAQQIIENGEVDQEVGEYENIYPYLAMYTGTLAISMNIFGEGYNAILFSNIFFDCISCVCLFFLFYLWKGEKEIGLFAATIWAINPLQIVFCSMPLAIIIVNMFIVIGLLCVFLILRFRHNWLKMSICSIALGIALSIGNAYRPIFVVFLLSFLLYWLVIMLSSKKELKYALASCSIAIVVYLAIGFVPGILHSTINSFYNGDKSQAGWTFYVGANYETKGRWSSEDRDVFFGPVLIDKAEGDITKANKIILKEGLKRYKKTLSEGHLVSHFLNKIGVVFGDVKGSIHDLPYIFHFSKENRVYRFVQDCISVFYYLIFAIIGFCLYGMLKKKERIKENMFLLFLIILFSGLFVASLLVEVMNRYCLPFFVIMLVMALGMSIRGKKKNNSVL